MTGAGAQLAGAEGWTAQVGGEEGGVKKQERETTKTGHGVEAMERIRVPPPSPLKF